MHSELASRIFLVEDDELSARALVRLFGSCGFETLVASSLVESRRLLSAWGAHPCGYAFVDHQLGDGFGLELLAELRQLEPAPAVALVSNWITSDLAAKAFREGAVPMAKPEDERTVKDLVALLAARRDRGAGGDRGPISARGVSTGAEVRLQFGAFTLAARELWTPTGRVHLRRMERAILAHLVERGGHPVSPLQIATEALKRSDGGAIRSVYSHVANLRVALGAYAALVETVAGAGGYRLAIEIFER